MRVLLARASKWMQVEAILPSVWFDVQRVDPKNS
jgi:hypothetical protein